MRELVHKRVTDRSDSVALAGLLPGFRVNGKPVRTRWVYDSLDGSSDLGEGQHGAAFMSDRSTVEKNDLFDKCIAQSS